MLFSVESLESFLSAVDLYNVGSPADIRYLVQICILGLSLLCLLGVSGLNSVIRMRQASTSINLTRSSLDSVSTDARVHGGSQRAHPGVALSLSSRDLKAVLQGSGLAIMHSNLQIGVDKCAGPDLPCALHRSTVVHTEGLRDKKEVLLMHAVSEVLSYCINLGSQPDIWKLPMLACFQPYG